MKKTFIIIVTLVVSVFAMQSCMKPADNAAAMKKIDSLTTAKLDAYKHSLDSACMADVMTQAKMKADSMMQAASKKGSKKTSSSTKKSTTGTVTDRPGSQQGQPKSVTDRQGTTNTSGPKSVKDRPGANNPPPPPKQ